MPLGAFRQSLNLANPVATVDYGTYQGYFRTSSTTALNAYNTAGVSQATVTHGVGTTRYVRARRIPGTTSHIVGISGITAVKFYRYTPGTGFVQLATFSAVSNNCDITFDTATNKIYMAAARTTTPFVQIYEADLSASVTTATQLSNPATLPAGQTMTVRFSPDGTRLAAYSSTTPFLTLYNRSGATFTSFGIPSNVSAVSLANNYVSLGWNANSTALAFGRFSGSINAVRVSNLSGNTWSGTGQAQIDTTNLLGTVSFNPNPLYSNIMLVSDDNDEFGRAFYYNFSNNTIATTTANTNINYSIEQAQWSPDGLKVFLQQGSTAGRLFDLNTAYTTTTDIATLLGTGTGLTVGSRGFDWMYH